MSIDEAIKHARDKAEELKNEAINCQKDSCRRCETDCIKCAEEHEQLAEWLEELKVLREKAKGDKWYQQGRADQRKEDEELNYHYQTSHECYMQGRTDTLTELWNIAISKYDEILSLEELAECIDEVKGE